MTPEDTKYLSYMYVAGAALMAGLTCVIGFRDRDPQAIIGVLLTIFMVARAYEIRHERTK